MDEHAKLKQLGKAVARTRKAQRLSQRALALMANTTQTEISKIENGGIDCGIVMLIRVSEALGVETRELFSF